MTSQKQLFSNERKAWIFLGLGFIALFSGAVFADNDGSGFPFALASVIFLVTSLIITSREDDRREVNKVDDRTKDM